jgi:N-sulfoglucosamine sulfohydrolase
MNSPKRRDFLKMASACGLAALAPSSLRGAPAAKPNLLLICAEDLGPTLGCYGDTQIATPNLDQLAAEGVRFDNAFTTQASCSPSRSSILTGLYPHQNGQLGLAHYGYTTKHDPAKLPNTLRDAGYRTGIMGKIHVQPEKSFAFDYRGLPHGATRNPDKVGKDFRAFLDQAPGQPFFFYLNLFDAHAPMLDQVDGFPADPIRPEDVRPWPWLGIDTPELRQRVAGYYNCARRVDLAVGEALRALAERKLENDTLVIFIGDHGPAFCRGKTTNYEAGLRVPFLVRQPGTVPAGGVRPQLVSFVDLMPTFLTAAGLPLPRPLAGLPLQPLLADAGAPWRETLCTEHTTHGPANYFPRRTIRDARYKLILNLEAASRANPVPSVDGCPATRQALAGDDETAKALHQLTVTPPPVEFYDLETDPCETRNLADDPAHRATRERLLAQLEQWRRETSDPTLTAEGLRELTAFHDRIRTETEQRLAAERERLGTTKLPRQAVQKAMQIQPDYAVPLPTP